MILIFITPLMLLIWSFLWKHEMRVRLMTCFVDIERQIRLKVRYKYVLYGTYLYHLSNAFDIISPFKICLCRDGLMIAFRFFLIVVITFMQYLEGDSVVSTEIMSRFILYILKFYAWKCKIFKTTGEAY